MLCGEGSEGSAPDCADKETNGGADRCCWLHTSVPSSGMRKWTEGGGSLQVTTLLQHTAAYCSPLITATISQPKYAVVVGVVSNICGCSFGVVSVCVQEEVTSAPNGRHLSFQWNAPKLSMEGILASKPTA